MKRLNCWIILVCFIALGCVASTLLTTSVYSAELKYRYYTYVITDDEVEIVDCDESVSGEIIIPSVIGGCSVTRIGSSAFKNCNELISITIPENVTSIGDYAFYGCTQLVDIDLPNDITSIEPYTFYFCRSLVNIKIPEKVTSIGSYAFCACDNLTNIDIPNNVEFIGTSAFQGCDGLADIEIPGNIETISNSAFNMCDGLINVKMAEGVKDIGEKAFYKCERLTNVEMPCSITSIGDSAFYGCTELNDITIQKSIVNIGVDAFNNCTSLKTATIVEGAVADIGEQAFYNCTALENAVLSTKITNIGDSAFEGCKNLLYIEIPNDVKYIKSATFSGCVNLENVVIPYGVTGIGRSAFSGCTNLKSIELPNSITNIESSAFSNCKSLVKIDIPYGVKNINNHLFIGCKSLSNVTIPSSVELIGIYAFSECTNLTSIIIPENVVNIWSSAFSHCTSLTSVVIPTTIETIELRAFQYCTALDNVYYMGNSSSWRQISIGDYNEDLKYAEIEYNYKLVYPSSISISNESISLSVGEDTTLVATVLPENSYDRTVQWISSNNEIATVSEEGVVTAISVGNAKISVITNVGKKVAYCDVTVTSKNIPCPVASRESGEIVKGTKIVLVSPTDEADIYYTVDGSIPTTESNKYLDAIEVNQNITINAIAIQEGKAISDVATFTYTVTEIGVPVLSISDAICVSGDYIDVDVQMKNNLGVAVVGFNLEYENGVFSLFDIKNGDVFSDEEMSLQQGKGIVKFTFLNCNGDNTENGTLCTLRFHINANGSGKKCEFKILDMECYDISENDVGFYGANGYVFIVDSYEE